jgi:hypothetical protein
MFDHFFHLRALRRTVYKKSLQPIVECTGAQEMLTLLCQVDAQRSG